MPNETILGINAGTTLQIDVPTPNLNEVVPVWDNFIIEHEVINNAINELKTKYLKDVKYSYHIEKIENQNSYIKHHNGKKIKRKNAVIINDIVYDKRIKNPPEVVYIKTKGWRLYDPEIHVLCDDNLYQEKKFMLTFINSENTKKTYSSLESYVKTNIKSKEEVVIFNPENRIIFDSIETAEKNNYYSPIESRENIELGTINNCLILVVRQFSKKPVKNSSSRHKYMDVNFTRKKTTNSMLNRKYGVESTTFVGTGGLDYTFGVEIETCSGYMPTAIYNLYGLNLSATKDGSLRDDDGVIRGGEYVTGVLVGDSGLENLYRSLKQINNRCFIDKRCGIHVHIGGFKNNEQFTIAAFRLGQLIQDEITQIFPMSRRGNSFANYLPNLKNLDYATFIKQHGYDAGIQIAYNDLYEKMANGRKLDPKVNKFQPHPGGRYTDRYTGNIPLEKLFRYMWLNLIPCNFNTRGTPPKNNLENKGVPFTLEFRPHSASMNFTKIKNWIVFCMAFVNFVENYPERIFNSDKITINDILNTVFAKKKIKNDLIAYFEARKNNFNNKSKSEAVEKENQEYVEEISYEKTKKREILCV